MVDYWYFNMSMTQFFLWSMVEKARNLKLILAALEQLLGLKNNFHKSELFCFDKAQDAAHYRWLTIVEWTLVAERLHKCLSSWKRKLLSLGGRLVHIKLVLKNMVLYMISFLLPKDVLQRLEYYKFRFFWQGDSEKKKYWLVKWSVVCSPKDRGGLGIHDLQVKNTALLGKWLSKTYWKWSVANSTKNKICRLKGFILGCLETWGFALLGWSDGNKKIFLTLRIMLYKKWIANTILER
jgi:hypothetical protein